MGPSVSECLRVLSWVQSLAPVSADELRRDCLRFNLDHREGGSSGEEERKALANLVVDGVFALVEQQGLGRREVPRFVLDLCRDQAAESLGLSLELVGDSGGLFPD